MTRTRFHVPRGPWSVAIPIAAILLIAGSALMIRLLPQGTEEPATVADGTPYLVFAEFGLNEDRIYLAPASNPDQRTLIDTVRHADGWGINPASAVAGPLVAYTVIPGDAAPARDTPAELWVVNVQTRNKTRLARDADLLVSPVFADDGATLIYRRSSGSQQEIVQVDVGALTRQVVHAEQTSFGIFPIGIDAEGALLFARLTEGGTDLYRTRRGQAPAFLYHLSDQIARDWALSPDGRALSYLAADFVNERAVYRAQMLSLGNLEAGSSFADAAPGGEQYGSAWLPDGSGVAVGQEATIEPGEAALVLGTDGSTRFLPAPAEGFDVPLGWSGDGKFLAVRSFDGRNSVYPGLDTTVIIDVTSGDRFPVRIPTEVIFIGWYAGV